MCRPLLADSAESWTPSPRCNKAALRPPLLVLCLHKLRHNSFAGVVRWICAPDVLATAHRMQDQLIVFMALACGTSRMLCRTPSLHTRTAVAVAQQLTGARFDVEVHPDNLFLITCSGTDLAAADNSA